MNKTMKITLSAALVLCLVLSLAACGGGGANLAGRYNLVSMTADGMTMTAADIEPIFGAGTTYLELRQDGSATLSLLGETMELRWQGTALFPADDPTDVVNFTVNGNQITIAVDGTSVTFAK